MARPLTGNDARREQRIQSLLLDRIVLRYERRISREIRREMNAAAKEIGQGNLYQPSGEHKRAMNSIMYSLWNDSARAFSERILSQQKAMSRIQEMKRVEVEPTQILDGIMREWINLYGAQHITDITETTRRDIQEIISEGIETGQSEREIAKAIREIAVTKSASRAQTISRTESHASANASAQASAKATGLEMIREWSASGGGRTRDDHRDADGQRVGMDEPFIVGGEQLMYPGDPSGKPEQVINCRCAVLYLVE